MILKLLLLTIILLLIALLGLSIRILIKKKGEFRSGCSSTPTEIKEQNIGCGCGSSACGS